MNTIFSIFLLLFSLISNNPTSKTYINDGNSMSPTINDGDRMVVNTDFKGNISRGDIIIFKHGEKEYCKRIIGIEGDRVESTKNGILVNDELKYKTTFPIVNPQIILKADEYYVIGDNIDNSQDSRSFGPIKKEDIIGRVVAIKHNQ